MKRVWFPRLTLQECKDLLRAHEHVGACITAMRRQSSPASTSMVALLDQADRIICTLYNRAEPAFLYHSRIHDQAELLRGARASSPTPEIMPAPEAGQEEEAE